MDLGLSGKVAVVSGASKGIGRACAEELANEGAQVVLAARGTAALDEAVDAITKRGGAAIGVQADMTKKSDVERVVGSAREAFGAPNILVTNVYPIDVLIDPEHPKRTFDDCTDDDFRTVYEQLVMSIVFLCRECLPAMKEQGWGRIVNIGSGYMRAAAPDLTLSNVGRVAVVGLMKSLALQLYPYGITVNSMATGAFDTYIADQYVRLQWKTTIRDMQEQNPAMRFGRPEEMAAIVASLCSERASYCTGQVIGVSGASSNQY